MWIGMNHIMSIRMFFFVYTHSKQENTTKKSTIFYLLI